MPRRKPTANEKQAFLLHLIILILKRTGVWDEMNPGEQRSFRNLLNRRMPGGFDPAMTGRP